MSEITRFWALCICIGVSENLKDFSEIIQTECKRSGFGSPKSLKILEANEHVLRFSDASDAQICIVFWSKPSVFHRKPSRESYVQLICV